MTHCHGSTHTTPWKEMQSGALRWKNPKDDMEWIKVVPKTWMDRLKMGGWSDVVSVALHNMTLWQPTIRLDGRGQCKISAMISNYNPKTHLNGQVFLWRKKSRSTTKMSNIECNPFVVLKTFIMAKNVVFLYKGIIETQLQKVYICFCDVFFVTIRPQLGL